MKTARYLRLERHIAASDTGGIIERWRYARRLLEDASAVTANGNLKHGVLDQIVESSRRAGYPLSAREIQRRLQCGRAYRSEAEIRHAVADFRTWHDLSDAGFPPVQVSLDADTEPFDPRDPDEKRRDAARDLSRHAGEESGQLSLFPDDKFGEMTTLAELAKYATEMAEMTERYARKDRDRAEYLAALVSAVDGDMSKTWGEARALLEAA